MIQTSNNYRTIDKVNDFKSIKKICENVIQAVIHDVKRQIFDCMTEYTNFDRDI